MPVSLPSIPFGARTLLLTSPELSGTDVLVLQVVFNQMLRVMHPPGGPMGPPVVANGVFGAQARGAVVDLQRYFGLIADGIVGPATFLACGQAVDRLVTYGGGALGSRPLGPGDAGGDVVVLQNRLNCFRYARALGGPADGTVGAGTGAAVGAFQADARARGAGIADAAGQVGPDTARALWFYTYAGGRNLERGANGLDTAWLQYYLANTTNPEDGQPFYTGSVDGYFGLRTHEAVQAFQAVSGLTADGIVGRGTYHAVGMRNAHGAPGPAPVPTMA